MKDYAVLKKIGDYNAEAIREFDTLDKATAFAVLMAESEEKKYIKYFIAQAILPAEDADKINACQALSRGLQHAPYKRQFI